MPFTPRNWTDGSAPAVSAANIEDLETRTTDWASAVAGTIAGVYNVVEYGADRTGAGYSDAAFADALDDIRELGGTISGAKLLVPHGTYKLAGPITIDCSIVMEGTSGASWYPGSDLLWDAGQSGITFTEHGEWSVIRDVGLRGNSSNQTPVPGTAIGIEMTAHGIKVENCFLRGWNRNGIRVEGLGGPINANNFKLDNVYVDHSGEDGINVVGNDANAGVVIGCASDYNGGWGMVDDSFLGNTWIGNHTAANGQSVNRNITSTLSGTITPTATAGTLADGSSFQDHGVVKLYRTTGGTYQEFCSFARSGNVLTLGRALGASDSAAPYGWPAGQQVEEVYGSYYKPSDQAVNNAVFVGNYSESGQGYVDFITNPAQIFGGLGAWEQGPDIGSAASITGYQGHVKASPDLRVPMIQTQGTAAGEAGTITFGGYGAAQPAIEIDHTWLADPFTIQAVAAYGHLNFAEVFTAYKYSYLRVLQGVQLAFGATGGAILQSGNDPTGTAGNQGQYVFNQSPSPGGDLGWVCTTTGGAGAAVWKSMGTIGS